MKRPDLENPLSTPEAREMRIEQLERRRNALRSAFDVTKKFMDTKLETELDEQFVTVSDVLEYMHLMQAFYANLKSKGEETLTLQKAEIDTTLSSLYQWATTIDELLQKDKSVSQILEIIDEEITSLRNQDAPEKNRKE